MSSRILLLCFFWFIPLSSLWSLDIPEKHELDHREYRRFMLDNGLKVLLVSDPDMNTSAAAMDISVGSLSDPKDRPGLAHFLEHMLFLGTRKYPEEGEYGRYLKSRGGYANAFTAGDHTNYHFQVHHEAFEGALDRFAQFFIAPLFNPEFTSREIQAVHNEHEKNLLNDDWRQYQLTNTFFDPEHPAHHFSTGNAETLKGVDSATLRAFYERNYSANRMALTLMSRLNLDWMENEVRAKFASIENRELEDLHYPVDYLPKSNKLRLIKIKPIKDLRQLEFMFALPSLDADFESQPGTIIGAILGHEGKGSLLSQLKAENLATSLSAGAYNNTPDYASFSIGITLTPEGLNKIERITELCFSGIARLRSEKVPEYLFQELKTRQQLEKVYSPRGEGAGAATELASNLNRYPMEWAENLRFSLSKMDEKAYQKVLDALVPQNMLMLLTAKEVDTDLKEPIYGTEYSVTEDEAWLKKILSITPDPSIVLPEPNPFMPKVAEPISEEPVLLLDETGLQLYYSQDLQFRRPKASFLYRFLPSANAMTLKNYSMQQLALACIKEQLNEYSYPASLAGVNVSLNNGEKGISLVLTGYNDSLGRLLEVSIDNMTTLKLSDERYEATKENMLRNLKNFVMEPAYQQARMISRQLRQALAFTPDEQANILMKCTRNEIEACIASMWKNNYIEAMVYGNVSAEQAIHTTRELQNKLHIKSIARNTVFEQAYLQWPANLKIDYRQGLETNNSCYRLDLRFGPDDLETRMMAEVLENYMSEPFYSEMRTRQQLGYIVWSGSFKDELNHYLTFIIQSGTHSADQLAEKARSFIPSLVDSFKALPPDEFSALKKAVREKLLEKPKSIGSKASIFFNLAYEEKARFDLNDQLLKALDELSQEKILARLKQCLDPEMEASLSLELFAKGSDPSKFKDDPQQGSNIKAKLTYIKH